MNKIILVIGLLLLFGCQDNSKNALEKKNETHKAFEDSGEIVKIRNLVSNDRGNLMEELYQELVDKDTALKKLENELEVSKSKHEELKSDFESYDGKSVSYYNALDNETRGVQDSILKKKIIALIEKSRRNYEVLKKDLNLSLGQLDQNEFSLNDHHFVLKMMLTLPLVEKYQKDKMPNSLRFKEFDEIQMEQVKKIKSLTPSF